MNNTSAVNTTRNKANQNIQVYVRVRPLNSRERCIRSYEVVDVNPPREIITRHTTDSKMTKKFTFDRTFGPDSQQADVYKTVVAPLIEEVLSGYNCTVFAYGQTGTGKTHTMVGTECPELKSSWEDESEVGIIPRALSHLFDELRLMELEFSMRVSYLELYNEELCDLLSSDDTTKIRIFDDSTKKGSLIIQGLEEIPVHSKDDVYKLLEKGKERRKTAQTLMNAQSSRSHTVFSILVHIKESGIDGEEMLKIGKLNLVDLAGSENVSKAGNEKGIRTRETVNINQSLLTLGRVITALVERTPHIPYRESKLTRLLQESLGGRTKTSIIATISPGHKDIEETLSTLEYAHRAKNIQNKPEVNQKLTKKIVLKEYTEEIDRLKRDLMAARDKNGIYLAEETYNDLQYKLDAQNKELNEKMLLVKALKDELATKERIFNEVSLNLIEKTEVLQATERNLNAVQSDLSQTKKVLTTTRRRYKEKKVLLDSHVKTEEELTNQATKLIEVADIATNDTEQLHNTLERRKDVDVKIQSVCEQFINRMKNAFGRMNENVCTLNQDHSSHTALIMDEIKNSTKLQNQFSSIAIEHIGSVSKSHEQSVKDFTDCVNLHTSQLSESTTSHQALVSSMLAEFRRKQDSQTTELNERLQEVARLLQTQNVIVETALNSIAERINVANNTVNEYSTAAKGRLEAIFQSTSNDFDEAISCVNSSVEERKLLSNRREQVMAAFMSQMRQISEEEQHQLDSSQNIATSIKTIQTNFQAKVKDEVQYVDVFCSQDKEQLKEMEQAICSVKQESEENVNKGKSEIEQSGAHLMACREGDLKTIADIQKSIEENSSAGLEVLAKCSEAVKRKGQESVAKMESECKSIVMMVSEENTRLKEYKTQSAALNTTLQNSVKDYSCRYQEQVEDCLVQLDKFHQSELKTYTPTGQTPSKREFSYPRILAATSPHSRIIKRLRQENEWSDLDTTSTITEDGETTITELSDNPILLNSTPIKGNDNEETEITSTSYKQANNSNQLILPTMRTSKPGSRKNSPALGNYNKDNKENIQQPL